MMNLHADFLSLWIGYTESAKLQKIRLVGFDSSEKLLQNYSLVQKGETFI